MTIERAFGDREKKVLSQQIKILDFYHYGLENL